MSSAPQEDFLRTPSKRDVLQGVPTSHRALFGAIALLFAVSAVTTIMWSMSMSAMDEMPMPGGWSMSMMWMRMPGQTWSGAAASFVGMWIVMMVAMMLPSLLPMLLCYREAVGRKSEAHLAMLTAWVATGYFLVWAAFGLGAFIVGDALACAEMQQPALSHGVPLGVGAVVLIAGALQFTAWKTRQLACCRMMPACNGAFAGNTRAALRQGLRLGLHCTYCCAGLTATLLAVGVMDLLAMGLVTAAITAERVMPGGARIARLIGAVLVALGLLLIVRATGLV